MGRATRSCSRCSLRWTSPCSARRRDLPPNTRHIAVRTGKRYGKTSLTARHERDLARAIAECRYLLRELDPDGTLRASERVGLITFKDCKPALAAALGIPAHRTGHFWGMRESLALEDCDVLLVVGTPTLRPEDVARLARAYYHADSSAIDETSVRGEDGRWHYHDPRMQPRGRCAHARGARHACAHGIGRGSSTGAGRVTLFQHALRFQEFRCQTQFP